MVNLGLHSFSNMKWLFYAYCQQHDELKAYIPRTNILSLSGLQAYPIEELKSTSLFKPADMSGGAGIQLLSTEEMSDYDKLNNRLKTCLITQESYAQLKPYYPFVMQEFLGDDIKVIRVYALVIADTTTNEIKVAVDAKNSFRGVKEEKENNFEISNKQYTTEEITKNEKQQVIKFLHDFFHRLGTTYNFTGFRYWEILAKHYIANHLVLTRSQRLLLISKFSIAVNQHQRFTQNMLSFYQCLLLEGFVKCLAASGDAQRFDNCVNGMLKNSFALIYMQNFRLYKKHNYRLANVLCNFGNLLAKGHPDKKGFMQVRISKLPEIQPIALYRTQRNRLYGFFDYLTTQDLENVCLTSKQHLNEVATWCGL